MLASSETKTVAEPQKVLLAALQHRARRLLDDLVLQGGDPQRPQLAIRFRDVGPLERLGPVCSAMDSIGEIVDPTFKVLRVITPRLTVDSRRGLLYGPCAPFGLGLGR